VNANDRLYIGKKESFKVSGDVYDIGHPSVRLPALSCLSNDEFVFKRILIMEQEDGLADRDQVKLPGHRIEKATRKCEETCFVSNSFLQLP
jgi:hypothetical protein